MSITTLPVGYPVEPPKKNVRPDAKTYQGHYVSIVPIDPDRDVDELFDCSHGSASFDALWTYMPYGPFENKSKMKMYLSNCAKSSDPLFFCIKEKASGKNSGVVSFLNIVEANLTIELGHIWYSPNVQRTRVNTETIYLMLCESFDRLKYRRVEWKCDALNVRSRAAAQRLGFSFEGIFYKHIITKNRNRDTAWFAMLDDDWAAIKANMENYLYGNDAVCSLRRMNQSVLRTVDTGAASQAQHS